MKLPVRFEIVTHVTDVKIDYRENCGKPVGLDIRGAKGVSALLESFYKA